MLNFFHENVIKNSKEDMEKPPSVTLQRRQTIDLGAVLRGQKSTSDRSAEAELPTDNPLLNQEIQVVNNATDCQLWMPTLVS